MITVINTMPAREIEERGISAVDSLLERGPVHVFVNDRPRYVILDEDAYTELAEAREEAERYRMKESLEDVRAGRVTSYASVEELMAAIERLDEEPFETLFDALRERKHDAFVAEVQQSMAEVVAGNVRRYDSAAALIAAIHAEDDGEPAREAPHVP